MISPLYCTNCNSTTDVVGLALCPEWINKYKYKELLKGNFTLHWSNVPFTAVAGDQALEQTIHRSGISQSGIIRSTKKKDYVTSWNLTYHETFSIKKLFKTLAHLDNNKYELQTHHELNKSITNDSELMVRKFIQKITSSIYLMIAAVHSDFPTFEHLLKHASKDSKNLLKDNNNV